jgi:hypothetical protein
MDDKELERRAREICYRLHAKSFKHCAYCKSITNLLRAVMDEAVEASAVVVEHSVTEQDFIFKQLDDKGSQMVVLMCKQYLASAIRGQRCAVKP